MHSHLDIFVNLHIYAYTRHMHIQHQFTHGCINCPESIPAVFPSVRSSIISSGEFQQTNSLNPFKSVIPSVSGREVSLINHFKWQVLTNEQLVIPMLIKSVIPSESRSEMSPIKCQVTSSNQRTTCIPLNIKWRVLTKWTSHPTSSNKWTPQATSSNKWTSHSTSFNKWTAPYISHTYIFLFWLFFVCDPIGSSNVDNNIKSNI